MFLKGMKINQADILKSVCVGWEGEKRKGETGVGKYFFFLYV